MRAVGRAPGRLQIVGRPHEDDVVLRAGYAFEGAVDWDELTTPPSTQGLAAG